MIALAVLFMFHKNPRRYSFYPTRISFFANQIRKTRRDKKDWVKPALKGAVIEQVHFRCWLYGVYGYEMD